MLLKLRHKLLLFWFGSVVVSLLLLGAIFSYLETELHEDHFRADIQEAVIDLQNWLDGRINSRLRTNRLLAERDDIVAATSMIHSYQDRYNYQASIFNPEKQYLADELAEQAHLDDLDLLAIHDINLELMAFYLSPPHESAGAGFLAYENGKGQVNLLSDDGAMSTVLADMPPFFSTIYPDPLKANESYAHLHAADNGLLLEIYVPIVRNLPDGSSRVVGILKSVDSLGKEFADAVTKMTGVEFIFATKRSGIIGNRHIDHIPPTAWEAPLLPLNSQEAPDWLWGQQDNYYYGAVRYALEQGEYAVFVFGSAKEMLTAELHAFRQSIYWVLLFSAIGFIPVGIFFLRRTVSDPISILKKSCEAISRGEYEYAHSVERGDELGFLSTSLKSMAYAIRDREKELQKLSMAVEQSPASVVIVDTKGNIEYVNPQFCNLTGYMPEEVLGKNPRILQSGETSEEVYKDLWTTITNGGQWRGVFRNKKKNGDYFWESATISPIRAQDGTITHYIAVKEDITERRRAEQQIAYQAFYDELTDLPNRRLLVERIEVELSRSRRREHYGAVLFLDLDNFKVINDSLGRRAGDVVLQHVAKQIESVLREEDTAARIGSDEFVILLSEIDDNPDAALLETQATIQKIQRSLSEPCRIEKREIHVTSSIGITIFPQETEEADDILKQADIAMYGAKQFGRNTFRFYEPNMQAAATERLTMEHDLHIALQNNELCLHYQPQIDGDGKLIGAECLLRWPHPKHGMIPPIKFIPVAEDTGQILALGEMVLRHACLQLKQLQDKGRNIRLAVNVSPIQFYKQDFVDQVKMILQQTGAAPGDLELELTEGTLITNVDETVEKIHQLRKLGIHFAIDDFGTGYSSLTYLKKLPINRLKIDQSFVRDITIDSSDATIVDTIIVMAHHLGLDVIAEGVETEAELEFLRNKGCREYQGYYFSHPLPADEFAQLLDNAQ